MTDFDNFSTTGNRNKYCTKRVQTTLLQPDYVSTLRGKTKNDTKTADRLNAVHSVELIVPDFRKKSFNVRLFPYLLEHFFRSLPTKKSFTFSLVLSKIYL